MIILEGIIIKDDARYEYAEDYLRGKDYVFHSPDSSPENFDFVVFPFKARVDELIYDDGYFEKLRKGALVFSGVKNPYVAGQCEKNGLVYHVIMGDRAVTLKNAVPTSEGVIAYLIANREDTVFNSRILVTGYGVCGSDLAKRLKALGARVYALVRGREKEAQAFGDGIIPVYMDELGEFPFDAVINTVPCQILTNETLDGFNGALMIDIASKPFGFDMEYAGKLNEKSAFLPGIPGKYAVRYAGTLIGEYIYSKRG